MTNKLVDDALVMVESHGTPTAVRWLAQQVETLKRQNLELTQVYEERGLQLKRLEAAVERTSKASEFSAKTYADLYEKRGLEIKNLEAALSREITRKNPTPCVYRTEISIGISKLKTIWDSHAVFPSDATANEIKDAFAILEDAADWFEVRARDDRKRVTDMEAQVVRIKNELRFVRQSLDPVIHKMSLNPWQAACGIARRENTELRVQVNAECSRRELQNMGPTEDQTVQWFFDCDGCYIDVIRSPEGNLSAYFRDRSTGKSVFIEKEPGDDPNSKQEHDQNTTQGIS